MTPLPKDINQAVEQAKIASQAAIADGLTRILIEIQIPELKIQPIAEQFIQAFTDRGSQLRIYFPDAGAAALARRDWGNTDYAVRGINDLNAEVRDDETLFIFVEPSSVEVLAVEKLCDTIGPRPVIFLNPSLEDVSVVGIGYAARQLRDRFLSVLDSCYFIRPLDQAALFRAYPGNWEIWREENDSYQKLTEMPTKPSSEDLDRILFTPSDAPADTAAPRKKPGLFTELQRFLKALSQ